VEDAQIGARVAAASVAASHRIRDAECSIRLRAHFYMEAPMTRLPINSTGGQEDSIECRWIKNVPIDIMHGLLGIRQDVSVA
jgi:hypothetical protein